MSKSNQLNTTMQALWRQGRSLLLKPLDTDNRFIDVLYTLGYWCSEFNLQVAGFPKDELKLEL